MRMMLGDSDVIIYQVEGGGVSTLKPVHHRSKTKSQGETFEQKNKCSWQDSSLL